MSSSRYNKLKALPFLILFLFLMGICIYLRNKYSLFFLNVGTIVFSAVSIFQGYTNHKELLITVVSHIFREQFLPGFIIAELLLGLGIFLLIIFFEKTGWSVPVESFIRNFYSGKKKVVKLAGALLLIALMTAVFFVYLGGIPVSTDEFAYSFQGDVLKTFRLFAPQPENSDFFQCENIIIKNGKWFAKYTIGFPLLLAAGMLFNAPWLVNPVFAALTLLFIYLLTDLLFGRRSGILAVLMAVLSPFFFLNGAAAFQPHITLGCSLIGAYYFFWLSVKRENFRYACLGGCFLSLGLLIRPVDSILLGLALTVVVLAELIKSEQRAVVIKNFLLVILFSGIGMLVLMLVNKVQTGDYFRFAFQMYEKKEVWGFGAYGHNIYKALWNLFYDTTRLLIWGAPLLLLSVIYSLYGKEKKHVFYFLFFCLVYNIFYFGWYTVGNYEYGPRYLFSGFLFLLPVAGYGISFFFEKAGSRLVYPSSVRMAFLIGILIYSFFASYAVFLPFLNQQLNGSLTVVTEKKLNELRAATGKDVIAFIVGSPENRVKTYTRNFSPPEKNKHLVLLFLEPERNAEILKKYSNRAAFIAYYLPDRKIFNFEPIPDLNNINPDTRAMFNLFAGVSYRMGVDNPEKAEKNWLDAYKLNSNNLAPLINLANMYLEDGKLDESKKYWEMVIENNPSVPLAYMSLGSIYEDRGDRENALKYYLEFLKLEPGSNSSEKVKDKIHFYQVNGRFPEEKMKK
ncbi:MAG: glycosyltransferase family 39 protein [Firmicutes bacterium]|nr:glycosyltransferase family 39 protein [Bacillota bacterium]